MRGSALLRVNRNQTHAPSTEMVIVVERSWASRSWKSSMH